MTSSVWSLYPHQTQMWMGDQWSDQTKGVWCEYSGFRGKWHVCLGCICNVTYICRAITWPTHWLYMCDSFKYNMGLHGILTTIGSSLKVTFSHEPICNLKVSTFIWNKLLLVRWIFICSNVIAKYVCDTFKTLHVVEMYMWHFYVEYYAILPHFKQASCLPAMQVLCCQILPHVANVF